MNRVDSGSAGSTRFLSIEAAIKNTRGYTDSEKYKEYQDDNPAKLMGVTNNLEPYATRADVMRIAMVRAQAMHLFPSKTNASKPLVRTGSEDLLKAALGDTFLTKAKFDGKITELTDKLIVLTSFDGEKQEVRLGNKVIKNSGAGLSVNHNFIAVVKKGQSIKKNDYLAESESVFNDGVLSSQGKMTLVALVPNTNLNEDAGLMSESYANTISLPYVNEQEIELDENMEILSFAKVGDEIKAGQELIKFKEGVSDIKMSANIDMMDIDNLFEDILDSSITSKVTGKIVDIQVVYNKSNPSTGDKKLFSYVTKVDKELPESEAKKRLMKDKSGFILGKRLSNTTKIIYKIEKNIKGLSGNKATLMQTKTVYRVVPDNEMPMTEDGRVVDLMLSTFSFITRYTIISASSAIITNTIMYTLADRWKTESPEKVRKQLYELIKLFTDEKEKKEYILTYLSSFESMSNKQLQDWIKKDFSVIIRPLKEPTLDRLVEIAKKFKVQIEHNLSYYNSDNGKYYKTKEPSLVGYTMIKHLVQTSVKNSNASHKVSNIDSQTGTLTNTDKVVQLSLEESINLYSQGIGPEVLPELTSIRGDDKHARTDMIAKIIKDGDYSISDVSSEGSGQVANLVDIYLQAAGYNSSIKSKTKVSKTSSDGTTKKVGSFN